MPRYHVVIDLFFDAPDIETALAIAGEYRVRGLQAASAKYPEADIDYDTIDPEVDEG